MNKVILMGRLTKDPELRYTQSANPVAVTRYGLAVRRQYTREGEADVDFVNIVAFGKAGEFAEKYFRKGQMVAVVGRLQVRNWEDQEGNKRVATDVVVEEQHFAGSKQDNAGQQQPSTNNYNPSGFTPIPGTMADEEDLPF